MCPLVHSTLFPAVLYAKRSLHTTTLGSDRDPRLPVALSQRRTEARCPGWEEIDPPAHSELGGGTDPQCLILALLLGHTLGVVAYSADLKLSCLGYAIHSRLGSGLAQSLNQVSAARAGGAQSPEPRVWGTCLGCRPAGCTPPPAPGLGVR